MSLWLMLPVRRILRLNTHYHKLLRVGYKSRYCLENVYPKSDASLDTSSHVQKLLTSKKEFSGYIPIEDLMVSYTPSSSHQLEKANTKVEVKVHVESVRWLSDKIKTRLLQRETGRITKDGFLVVSSEKTSRQMINQADCLDQLRTIIHNSLDEVQQTRIKETPRTIMRVKKSTLQAV